MRCPISGVSADGCIMTFDEIEAAIGSAAATDLATRVHELTQAARQSDDPDAHTDAVGELLTALLAVLVTRSTSAGGELVRAQAYGDRLIDLVDTMSDLAAQEPGPRVLQ